MYVDYVVRRASYCCTMNGGTAIITPKSVIFYTVVTSDLQALHSLPTTLPLVHWLDAGVI